MVDRGHNGRVVVKVWYANSFDVGHAGLQFKIDCGQEVANGESIAEYMRVITDPLQAQGLFRQLGIGLLHWMDAFGPIDEGSGPDSTGRDG